MILLYYIHVDGDRERVEFYMGIACYVPLPNYSPKVKKPCVIGGAVDPEMVYFPTK